MRTFASVAVVLVGLAVALGQAKAPSKDDKKPDAPAPVLVKGQLPRYFKSLGLSDGQKKAVYMVRAASAAKIARLNEEIAAVRLREREDTEAVLTEAQRSRLKELRAGADSKK